MDNSKYLALVDLVGEKFAQAVSEKAADGLEALHWAGDPPVWAAGEVSQEHNLTWRGMPLLCHDLDDECSTWTCEYCGKVNPGSALTCGQGEWDGCGASRPAEEEQSGAILHLRSNGESCDGGVAVRRLDGSVIRFG